MSKREDTSQVDMKPGSGDRCVTGERQGMPGGKIGEAVQPAGTPSSQLGADGQASGSGTQPSAGGTAPIKAETPKTVADAFGVEGDPGCGPSVSNYPGLAD
jgi:hypothetical protein